jgi:hypothetical protein
LSTIVYQRDGEQDGQPPPRRPRHVRPLPGEPEEHRDHRQRPQHPQHVLGQRGRPQARVEQRQAPAPAAPVGHHEARVGERDEQDHHQVGLDLAAEHEDAEVGGDEEPGQQAHAQPAQDHPQSPGDRGQADGGQGRPHARGRLADAGGGEGQRHQPVRERRLVEVAHAVDPERDDVARPEERLRDGGVEALGRVEEGPGPEPEQVHQAHRQQGETERDPRHRARYPGRLR